MQKVAGKVYRVVGPVVELEEVTFLRMLDVVEVGELKLVGEVMQLKGDHAYVQVYEDTTSLKAGDLVYSEGQPLMVALGPGLLGTIYDGIQRPEELIEKQQGYYIGRGVHLDALDLKKKWHFKPVKTAGTEVKGGEIIGEVQETFLIKHRVMIPPDQAGKIKKIVPEGDYTVQDKIAELETETGTKDITMLQYWPVRVGRPYKTKEGITEPLLTGQRVIDTLFPIGKGSCVAVPGGFGTGKTVVQHQLAKWSDAEIVVYIGCGERGNEMTDILIHFPKLIDPHTGRPLMERTIFIANTSNMPVAAREASIYTGITLAEYYRDMGYNVALMADSTSRWAEALRELSGRLEEMPMEEGFPAYLPSRLAAFYERAGHVKTLAGNEGSISIIAAVSPPGGDFSEPVTAHTRRFVRAFWALDRDLANSRHYPSISWLDSYSEYLIDIEDWWSKNISEDWLELRYTMMDLLQKEQRLQQVVKLVGPDVLPQAQRLVLEICSVFKNGFLQQAAFDPIDTYTSAKKQFLMLKSIVTLYKASEEAVKKGSNVSDIWEMPVYQQVLRMKTDYPEDKLADLEKMPDKIKAALQGMGI